MNTHRSDALHIRRPTEKRQSFKENINDKPRLPEHTWEHLARQFRCGYPPRPMVEPMHQGHWSSLDDYVDLGEREP